MARLGPGFRFHPTDEELVVFYLKRKITGNLSRYDHIAVVDVYKLEPWDLPSMSKLKTKDLEWYFFSILDRKYGNGSRTNRATEKGYWKTTGKDRAVNQGDRTVGMKKTLVYHIGRAPHGRRTNWVMHEYKLLEEELARAGTVQDMFVLCRIFEKSGAGPKNGAKYGAPLDEKEWDEEVEEEKKVVPLQSAENVAENVVPVAPLPVADDGVFDAGAYVETDDLDRELDFSDIIGTVTFPSWNYHYGECSTQAEHSQVSTKDQEPLASTFGISVPENGQPLDMTEQHVVVTDSVKDEHSGEPSNFENLLNFNDPGNDMDLDLLYMDAMEKLPLLDEGSFLETNDLAVVNEGDPIKDDPSGDAMLDEYLALPDDDICKYISFDSQISESENSIPNQGPLFTQQNVEGENTDNDVVSKLYSEAKTSNEASSVQNKQEKLVPGSTNSFVEQAYGWLANIPAAPAHALEFPAKEIALGLHPAAQSSSPAHITTGMISITNVTFRGNAMDWTMGKNGGFNTVVSTGFSQPDVDSGLVSSKTAFVLSHGWIFLTGFSVLILSLSCKIGSIMYTGK
ncbi:NAC domain-containing protein 78 [Cajanus cajan]|uniref:NAC domain-containing protein 78 n=1 Tax=Cajanus cajan TaxID=3821 RepID=UPI00098DB635|nr:NAC domain-containing protein 78 [Cajanus cajan]